MSLWNFWKHKWAKFKQILSKTAKNLCWKFMMIKVDSSFQKSLIYSLCEWHECSFCLSLQKSKYDNFARYREQKSVSKICLQTHKFKYCLYPMDCHTHKVRSQWRFDKIYTHQRFLAKKPSNAHKLKSFLKTKRVITRIYLFQLKNYKFLKNL